MSESATKRKKGVDTNELKYLDKLLKQKDLIICNQQVAIKDLQKQTKLM